MGKLPYRMGGYDAASRRDLGFCRSTIIAGHSNANLLTEDGNLPCTAVRFNETLYWGQHDKVALSRGCVDSDHSYVPVARR